MIKIENFSKNYKTEKVFDNFSLDIEEGKITCILGQSGSGKSTLLNAIAGLIDYQGHIIAPPLSYAFQKPNLFYNLTVLQNLTLVNPDEIRAKNLLESFYILEKKDAFPRTLSGGQEIRVSLARAFLFDKPLTLLDEPFSGLDIGLRFRVIERIKELQKDKKNTILLVTHDIREAVEIADRILVLDKGKIIYDEKCVKEKTEKEIFDLLVNISSFED